MNDNIRFYMSQSNISPVDYTWMDLSEYTVSSEDWSFVLSVVGSLNKTPIKDHPLPFERMAVVVDCPVQIAKETYGLSLATIVREGGVIFYTLHLYVGDSKYPAVSGVISDDNIELPKVENKKAMQFTLEKRFKKQIEKNGYAEQDIINVFGDHYLSTVRKLYTLTVKPDPLVPVGRPYGDIAKNAKRARKGKSQFWEWKTIELKSVVTLPSAPLGGTHASPKPHERIGHWRQYKSGKRVFIKAHIVNKHKIESEGFIFHDYVKN